MKYYRMFGIFFLLLLIQIGEGCLNSNEKQGSCTGCLPTHILQSGRCFQKIRGCTKQIKQVCEICQKGYILSGSACIRQAQYYNITTLNPPPQIIQEQKLNSSQINSILGGYTQTKDFQNQLYLISLKQLYEQYEFLKTFKIYKVQEQVVNGKNYLFYIINPQNYDLYLAKVYIKLDKLQTTVSEIYKNDISIKKDQVNPISNGLPPVPGGWREFNNINDLRYVQVKNYLFQSIEGLKQYKIQRVQYQIVAGINFMFFYSYKNEKFIVNVYKPFVGNPKTIQVWGKEPYKVVQEYKQTSTPIVPPAVTGQLQIVSPQNYEKQPFLSAKKQIIRIFPHFTNNMIIQVKRQVVSGTNYIVYFSLNPQEIIEIKLFIPLIFSPQPLQVIYIKKNNTIIYPAQQPPSTNSTISNQTSTSSSQQQSPYPSQPHQQQQSSYPTNIGQVYSFHHDPIFQQLYKFFQLKINILNLPQIVEVQRKKYNENKINQYWEYKIIYSDIEYGIVRYYEKFSIFDVVSYRADGTEIYRLGEQLGTKNNQRKQSVLVQKLKALQPQRFSKFLVRQITFIPLSESFGVYKMNIYTHQGNFQIQMLDRGQLFLIQITLISSQSTCFQIPIHTTTPSTQQQSIISQLKTYLISKYTFSSYQLTNSLINIALNKNIYEVQYCLLWTRKDFKKLQVIVIETNNTFVIKELNVLNQGKYVIGQNVQDLQNKIKEKYPKELEGFKNVVTITNGSQYEVVFASQNEIYTYTKNNQKSTEKLQKSNFIQSLECLSSDSQPTVCLSCKQKDFLYERKCYQKSQNCEIQIGNICVLCDKYSFNIKGKCIKNCQEVFKLN